MNYIHIRFWNDCNIGVVNYSNGYKNQIYFESELLAPEYFSEKEVLINGNNEELDLYQRFNKIYKFQLVVPEYVVDALHFIKLHKNVELTLINSEKGILHQSTISNITVTSAYESIFLDCFATVDFKFQMSTPIQVNGCCN